MSETRDGWKVVEHGFDDFNVQYGDDVGERVFQAEPAESTGFSREEADIIAAAMNQAEKTE